MQHKQTHIMTGIRDSLFEVLSSRSMTSGRDPFGENTKTYKLMTSDRRMKIGGGRGQRCPCMGPARSHWLSAQRLEAPRRPGQP